MEDDVRRVKAAPLVPSGGQTPVQLCRDVGIQRPTGRDLLRHCDNRGQWDGRPYHNRMPVILAERDYDMWISADTALIDTLALLRPYDGNDLAMHAVSKMVNSVKNDMPECIATAA